MSTKLIDGDYILEDGAGWFETAGYAVRIFTDGDGNVFVDVYQSGDEMGDGVGCAIFAPSLKAKA